MGTNSPYFLTTDTAARRNMERSLVSDTTYHAHSYLRCCF